MSLERRYQRLLLAYPRAYRAERGAEIVGTYLDFAGPGRRWPSPGDAADLLAGGLRQRLRANGADGAVDGLRVAASLALSTGAALATWWLMTMPASWRNVVIPGPLPPPLHSLGPFATLGVLPYSAWILAALAAMLSTAWAARALLAAALVLSVGVVAAGGLTVYLAPPLPTLLPLCCLGVLALARRAPGSLWARLAPTVAMAGTAAATLAHQLPQQTDLQAYVSQDRLRALAIALIAGTVAAGLGYRIRHDARGLWAALILFTPAVLLYDLPWTYGFGGYSLWQVAGRTAVDTAVAVLAGYLIALIATRRRVLGYVAALDAGQRRAAGYVAELAASRRAAPQVCPACGHPLAAEPPPPAAG